MTVRVVILQQGSPHILREWREELGLPREDCWQEGSCCWPEGMMNGRPEPMEVFLCLERETLADGYDTVHLREVIQHVHDAMWEAELRVVVDQRLLLEGQKQFRESRENWFRMLLENGVVDIVELPIDPTDNTRFAEAAARSRKRARVLGTHGAGGSCKCLVYKTPDPTSEVEAFLAPYLVRSTSDLDDESCLLILRNQCDDDGLEFVRSVLEKLPRGRIVVGVVDEVEEPPLELQLLCKKWSCELVRFSGLFELQYFLRSLNVAGRSRGCARLGVEAVQVVPEYLFSDRPPQLLVTHSFTHTDVGGCHAAARDTRRLRQVLPDRTKIEVHPAVQCVTLPGVLERLRPLLAWVHIGHGRGKEGLQQAGGVFKTAEEWLKCFASYQSSLALAVFSTCQSEVVARRFAEAGVGVAIGFVDDVPKGVCGLLTQIVVAAALRSNGERDEILRAFWQGRELLVKEYPAAKPVSFWSNHRRTE